jgi:hypothetical protein
MSAGRVRIALPVAVLLLAGAAVAQETPQDWIKRILDPTTIGVTPFPGSQLNRKITVDTIRTDDPRKRIAVYMAPLDQLTAAAEHFTKTLGVKPTTTAEGSPFERHLFQLRGEGDYPKQAEGLTIVILRSPFVDNSAQITMDYLPPR